MSPEPSASAHDADRPRIGVVIPCHNDGPFVGEALASLKGPEPIEIVIVDDGSDEATRTTLVRAAAADTAVSVVRHERNLGLAEARNTGARALRTPFVYFCDADDVVEEGALTTLADALEGAPGTNFAFGSLTFTGAVEGVRRPPPWDPWRLLYNNFWSASSMFRRTDLLEAGGFDTRAGWEDWDFFLKVAGLGWSGVRVDRQIFRYRIHAQARGRQLSHAQRHFRSEYRKLRSLHAPLFARRRELSRQSDAAWPETLLWPAVGAAYATLPSFTSRGVVRLKNVWAWRLRALRRDVHRRVGHHPERAAER